MVSPSTLKRWRWLLIQRLGDVVYARLLGKEMIILNTLQAARDLLEKRSAIYSDRPRSVLLEELYVFQCMVATTAEFCDQNGLARCYDEHAVWSSVSKASSLCTANFQSGCREVVSTFTAPGNGYPSQQLCKRPDFFCATL